MKRLILFIIFFIYPFNASSLNIEKSIENTVKNNSKVKIGYEKLIESKELIENALGSKKPKVTATISGTYSKSESKSSTSTTTPETLTDKYKLSVTQNLFDAGFNELEIERSRISFNNEEINFQIIIQDLILDAINGYLTVINYKKSLEATEKNFELVSQALEEIKTKFTLGSATLYELQNAESSYATSSANLYAAQQNYEISKKSFSRIVGLKPINLEEIVEIDSSINFDQSLQKSLVSNLNLKLISNEIENNKILILKEEKSKKANLDFTGSAEYSDDGRIDSGSETTKGSIALTLTIPLYQQGIDDSNIRKYHSKILQSEFNYEDFKEDLEIQISNTFKDFNISKIKMDSNLAIIKSIETSLKSLNEEYQLGTKTVLDIVEEEGKLLNAIVEYQNNKKDYLVNYFRIKSLEGELLNDFNHYLPKVN